MCSLLLSPIWQLRNGCSEEVHKLLKVMWPSASLEASRSQPPDSSLPHTVHLCPGACLFLAASRFVDLTGLHDSLCVDFSLAVSEVLHEDLTEVSLVAMIARTVGTGKVSLVKWKHLSEGVMLWLRPSPAHCQQNALTAVSQTSMLESVASTDRIRLISARNYASSRK